MINSFSKIIILSCLLLAFSVFVTAQTKSRQRVNVSITGVYAGFSLPLIGVNGDMQTYMRTFYFRENGTYVTELDEPNWQTRVDGNYKIIGNKLIIQSNLAGDSPSEIEIKENGGFLFYSGASLMKLNAVSSIPAIVVNNNSGASSGGIGTNNIFVAVSSSDLYNFDGRGNFSHNSSSASVISGASVGGGKSKNNSGGGTYTIKNGLLTLNYSDGKVVKKSFFYSESDGNGTALIDGSFHFETEESKRTQPNVITKVNNESKTPQTKSSATATLNCVYGGTSIPLDRASSFVYTFYFRPNGTYTTKLDKPNWQIDVEGTYKIDGKKVTLYPKKSGAETEELTLENDGNTLVYNANRLDKLNVVNSIPSVLVERIGGYVSGGLGESRLYNRYDFDGKISFDGRGNFSEYFVNDSKPSERTGKYFIKDSLLTLRYADGEVISTSFFYIEFNGKGQSLINGEFYYEPQNAKNNAIVKTSKSNATSKNAITSTLNGAYAGSSVPVFFPGGGSSSSSYRYYFRPNGTYTTELDEPDWQTRIDGNYKILKGKVTLFPKTVGENPFEMDIEEEGASLVYGGNTLFKFNVMNNIPAVVVENSGGTSSGGGATGTTFVGVSFSGIYNFDGKGRFSNNASSSSVISGSNVGGGSSNESGGSGTYTIKDSLLTLNYNNGTVVKRSFFYIEFSHGGTALIDGSLYYEPDEAEKSKINNNAETPTAKELSPIESAEKREDLIIKSSRILKLANMAHGGDKLDSLKTIRLTGKALGFEITILIDATNQKVRNEFRKNGKLMLVEQLDGENSWQWGDNLKSPITNQKRKELKKSLTTGLFAMQTNAIESAAFQTADPNLKGNLKSLLVLVDGEKYGMIFDDKNRLVAELSTEDGILQTTYSEDYRNVGGIMIPFKSKVVLGEKSVEVKYSMIEVNPNFTEKDWSVPQ